MKKNEMQTIDVHLKLPKQYMEFWEELRRIYGLPEEALDKIATNQMILYLNMVYDDLSQQPILEIDPRDIRKSLSLKEDSKEEKKEGEE